MTTCADLLERTRRHLYTDTRDARNRLAAGIDGSATALTFTGALAGIQEGAVIACGLEEMHVWQVSADGATVERGVNGSTAATHAAGDTVFVNPKHSGFSIFQALNEDLLDLSSPGNGLFSVKTVTVNYDSGTDAYDLTAVTDLVDILDVTYDANNGTERWPSIPRAAWRLRRAQPAAEFPSGLSFTVNGYAESGRPINISYKSGFTPLTGLTDNVVTVAGLSASMVDIPPLGAAIRLTAGTEVARNFLNQGETRRADEVPAGARNAAPRGLMQLRATRIGAEAARLYAQYPVVTA